MKALVTGASGFVGSAVCRALIDCGWTVFGWDRRDGAPHGVDFHLVDIATARIDSLVAECKPMLVVHAAGPASVSASREAPGDDFAASVQPLSRLLDGLRKVNPSPRFIFVSSAAVYGEPGPLPVGENAPRSPLSPYGYHKLISESLLDEYRRCFGIESISARLFSTFGVEQRRLLVWELFRQAVSDSDTVTLQGSGLEVRDYLSITDIGRGIAELARADWAGCDAVNFASGQAISTFELAELVMKFVGKNKEIVVRNLQRPGEPVCWRANVDLLRRFWPGLPSGFEESLNKCVRAWVNHA